MNSNIHIQVLKGDERIPFITDLAKLRIRIFNDYPYLYVGDLEFETKYLSAYVECPQSVMIVVSDGTKVVGASTAIPLCYEHDEFKKPFIDNGFNINDVFYFGESVLLHEYRGRNIYHHFFKEREAAAKAQGFNLVAFCAVKRSDDDPRKPADYKPLEKIWQRYGYQHHPELCAYYAWKEIGEEHETPKPLTFWLKRI